MGSSLAQRLAELDYEIGRLHEHAVAEETDELAALVATAQIDELLEQRHNLTAQLRAAPAS